jgi:parallel beta-helix repeat protein
MRLFLPSTPVIPKFQDGMFIQNLIDSTDKVILESGEYVLNDSLTLKSNMVLRGSGNTVLTFVNDINPTSLRQSMIYGKNLVNVTIENLILDGNRENQHGGLQYGIWFENASFSAIKDNLISNFKGNAISIYVSNNNVVEKNRIVNNAYNGIHIQSSNFNIAKNNVCTFGRYGIEIGYSHSHGNILENNECRYNREFGIELWYSVDNIVRNNVCNNNDISGIYVGLCCERNLIEYNKLFGNGKWGIHIRYSMHNILVHNSGQLIWISGYTPEYSQNDVELNTLIGKAE